MKSILVPVDFSKSSEHAAHYALHLAKHINANITLCHAIFNPVEVPIEAFDSWPGYDLTTLKEESTGSLDELAFKLRNKVIDFSTPTSFQPAINCVVEAGGVIDVITRLADKEAVQLIVMGMTGAGTLSRLLFGSISRSMIDKTTIPLVLVPEGFLFSNIAKIAFATSLVDEDIEAIHTLAGFASHFHAELLVAHVSDRDDDKIHQEKLANFLSKVTDQVNYNKIYFRHVEKQAVDKGLNWLTAHGLIDLLVMVHRQKGVLDNLFLSHTHARANHLNIPLLIMPDGAYPMLR